MNLFLFVFIATFALTSCSVHRSRAVTVVSASEVTWEKLNPARGDKSPQAATLWGDRNGSPATGFLVKFVDGFSSPPHIHNVSYRGVVISGLIHNDDPEASHMWMPKGSFWTQPKGEAHITAAKGTTNIAYIEIDEGPYLVRPTDAAFDSGERPVNVDVSNLVWLDSIEVPSVQVAFLWGVPKENRLNGTFVKFPGGFTGSIRSTNSTLHAVAIQGRYNYGPVSKSGVTFMTPGSYFSSTEDSVHRISCEASESCVFYVRALGRYSLAAR